MKFVKFIQGGHARLLLFYTILLLCRGCVCGVYLNLFMTNPLHVETDVSAAAATGPESSRRMDDARTFDSSPLDDDENRRRFRVQHRNRQHAKDIFSTDELSEDDSERKQVTNCVDDRHCASGMYCDRHYGLCKPYRTEGQPCRRDAQCALGYDCMFGRCLSSAEPGHKGARCVDDRDCVPGLCCARQHGEKICKPKLKLGQNCYVSDGGLASWGNDVCTCDEGLLCGYVGARRPPDAKISTTASPTTAGSSSENSDWFDGWFNSWMWTDQNRMRCARL